MTQFKVNEGWPNIKAVKKVRPLGRQTPIVWSVEPAFGCRQIFWPR